MGGMAGERLGTAGFHRFGSAVLFGGTCWPRRERECVLALVCHLFGLECADYLMGVECHPGGHFGLDPELLVHVDGVLGFPFHQDETPQQLLGQFPAHPLLDGLRVSALLLGSQMALAQFRQRILHLHHLGSMVFDYRRGRRDTLDFVS